MDDFRTQLGGVIDVMLAGGIKPSFLVADLFGAEHVKRAHGADSFESFRSAAIASISGGANGAEVFCYDEQILVAILPGFPRLKTFALVDKLSRALRLLGQSYDCMLEPEFDSIEYDPEKGIAGLISELVKVRLARDVA